MNKRYRLGEIEEAVSEMEELIGLEDDIAEIDDDFQIVVSGWSVYVESLNLTLRQGIACVWDAEEGLFMPDFDVTIVYEGNIETGYSRSDASVVNESGESICHKWDVVVSQDYGVAAMALGKGAYVIHQSGKWYTNENIDQMLMERHFNKKARRSSYKNHMKGIWHD